MGKTYLCPICGYSHNLTDLAKCVNNEKTRITENEKLAVIKTLARKREGIMNMFSNINWAVKEYNDIAENYNDTYVEDGEDPAGIFDINISFGLNDGDVRLVTPEKEVIDRNTPRNDKVKSRLVVAEDADLSTLINTQLGF